MPGGGSSSERESAPRGTRATARRTSQGGVRYRRPLVTDSINLHQSLWIYTRLKALGWNEKQLLAELNDAFTPQTVKSWVTGVNAAPREVVEALAAAEAPGVPPDPHLLNVYDRLERVRKLGSPPTALALSLALALDSGFDPPSQEAPAREAPAAKSTNKRQMWKSATYLLDTAVRRPGIDPGSILIDMPGFEAAFSKLGPQVDVAVDWRETLWRALLKKWHVRHVLSWDARSPEVLPDAVQAELVANLLYAAAVGGNYEPVIRSPRPSTNTIAVEGVGILTGWHGVYSLRLDDTREHDRELGRKLAASLIKAGDAGNRSAIPSLVLGVDGYDRLRFDMALAAAESDLRAEHCMVKAGLPTALMPAEVAEAQEEAWSAGKDETEAAYVKVHSVVRARRRAAFDDVMARRNTRYRDIITRQGVRQYLELDPAPPEGDLGEEAFGGRYLTVPQKAAHVQHVTELLQRHPGKYQLGLVASEDLLVPIDQNWWAATRGAGADSQAVFFVVLFQRNVRQGWLFDSGSTTMVDAFYSLFDLLWETLPPLAKNRTATMQTLRNWAAEAVTLDAQRRATEADGVDA